MNMKILGAGLVLVILLSMTRCGSSDNGEYTFVKPSQTDMIHSFSRNNQFSPWLSNKEYKSRFKNKSAYYKLHKSYPAYIEVDELGNRRVIDIPYEPTFHWRCSSSRLKEDFQKIHIKETLNRGKKLLSLSILNKDGIDVYSAVWVSADAYERESKKLDKLGISAPEFVE